MSALPACEFELTLTLLLLAELRLPAASTV